MPASPPAPWEEYARDLGLELQRRRVALGMSQEALAHRAGLTRNYYQLLERGRLSTGAPANPSLRLLVQLAEVLDARVADLLPDSEADAYEGPSSRS